MGRQPFFLLGAEPAGAALLESFLSSHPEVHWAGNFDHALAWDASHASEWPPLVAYWQQLALSERVRELGLKIDPSLEFPDLVRFLLDQQRVGAAGALLGVSLRAHYDRALKLWPHARFVFVAASPHRARAVGPEGGPCLAPRDAVRLWRKVAADIRPERRLEIRYEMLVGAPAGVLESVCALLGVEFSSCILRAPRAIPDLPGVREPECAPAPRPSRRTP